MCVSVKITHSHINPPEAVAGSGEMCYTSQHPLCFTAPKGNTLSQAGRLKSVHLCSLYLTHRWRMALAVV